MAAYDVLGDAAHQRGVPLRVHAVVAHPLAHLAVEHLDQLTVRVLQLLARGSHPIARRQSGLYDCQNALGFG